MPSTCPSFVPSWNFFIFPPRSSKDLEEAALITSLQAGDPTAYRWIVTAYKTQVYHTCLGFMGNVEDAEDLTQEVFVEVFRSIHTFRAEAKFSTWLHRIAITKSLETLRNRRRKKRTAQLLSIFGIQHTSYEPQADRFDHPGIALERKEQAQQLFAAIDTLPDQQRTAFVLHKVEDKTYQEVAELMGISPSAVDSLIFRARATLKKRLAKLLDQK